MKKKKNIITLEVDDDGMMEDVAHLLFRTPQPGYLFADNMNRLYGYALHRIDDMELDGAAWPLYTYSDKIDHLRYYLIEKPRTATTYPAWSAGDKLLIIKGDAAQQMADYIYEDFTDPLPVDSGDLLAEEHERLRNEMLSDFTVVSMIDGQQCIAIHTYIEIKRLDIAE